jgi:hypothetical protein
MTMSVLARDLRGVRGENIDGKGGKNGFGGDVEYIFSVALFTVRSISDKHATHQPTTSTRIVDG